MSDQPLPAADDADFLPFWEFFQTMVEAENISLTLRPCHQEICEMYQAAFLGEMPGYEYFVVNMPRRIGKTKILQALACWVLGEFGDSQNLYGSYSDKLVTRTIAYAALTMERPWYQELYQPILGTQRADLITTTAGGMLYGAGTGATIAGFGAGLKEPAGGMIALDDPAKPDHATSKVESANVIENFEMTWKGCRNSDQWCPIFINAQRIGAGDLPDYVETTYRNKTFKLRFPCMVGGVSAFPETWKTDTLLDLQKTRTGRYVLETQFNQNSATLGGNLITIESFHRWNPMTTSIKFEKTVMTCDTALKTKQANDFSCVGLFGLFQKKMYWIDLLHGKWETPDLITNCQTFWEKWTTQEVRDNGIPRPRFIIEEKAAGTPLLQSLKRLGIPAQGIERDIDKVRRVKQIMPYIETGMVVVPQDGCVPWIAGALAEIGEFKDDGTAAHDDRVDLLTDSCEQLLARKLSGFDVLFDKP